MPFLVKADFSTHLYDEVVEAITRANDATVTRAINAGIAETKMYLSRFDLLALFGDGTSDPTVEDIYLEHLKSMVKDIACWHLIKLSNPNVNMQLFRTLYEDATKMLEKIMKGQADPQGWPYKADDPETDFNENSFIQASSNEKRTQHF